MRRPTGAALGLRVVTTSSGLSLPDSDLSGDWFPSHAEAPLPRRDEYHARAAVCRGPFETTGGTLLCPPVVKKGGVFEPPPPTVSKLASGPPKTPYAPVAQLDRAWDF